MTSPRDPLPADPLPVDALPPDAGALMAPLAPFEPNPVLAVALSGGPDSLAAVLLLAPWAAACGGRLVALTVDHGLRSESADEAARVGGWMAARGIEHRILRWDGDKPATGLQEAGRAARYRLLEQACRAQGVLHLVLGHHREDQAETVLFRLVRGSGVDGLGGMAPVRETRHVRLLRPFLDLPKSALVETCRRAGQAFIEDPSNLSENFARVRLRRIGTLLAPEGLEPAVLAETARRARSARAALETALAELLAVRAAFESPGLVLSVAGWHSVPEELRIRAWAALLGRAGGTGRPLRRQKLELLDQRVINGQRPGAPAMAGSSLGGCLVRPAGAGRISVAPEAGRAGTVRTGQRPLTLNGVTVVSGMRNII